MLEEGGYEPDIILIVTSSADRVISTMSTVPDKFDVKLSVWQHDKHILDITNRKEITAYLMEDTCTQSIHQP